MKTFGFLDTARSQSRRQRRTQALSYLTAAQIEALETRNLLAVASISYTFTVRSQAGQPIAGAQIAVATATACYETITTNAQGQAKITTQGLIRTVQTYKSGYAADTVSFDNSNYNLTRTLTPLSSGLNVRAQAVVGDVLNLFGSKQYLGRVDVNKILASSVFASAAVAGTCFIGTGTPAAPAAAACLTVAGPAVAHTGTAWAVYQAAMVLGLNPATKLDVYYRPALNQLQFIRVN